MKVFVLLFATLLGLSLTTHAGLMTGSFEVDRLQAQEQMNAARKMLAPYIEVKDGVKNIRLIGHRMGDFPEYPLDPSIINVKNPHPYRDIADLMDEAFDENILNLSGIELDAQLVDKGENPTFQISGMEQVYVAHEPLHGKIISPEAESYMEQNSLYEAYKHFFLHYRGQGKKLYLELKTDNTGVTYSGHPELTARDKKLLDEIIKVLERVFEEENLTPTDIKELGFVSFNFYALEYLAQHFILSKKYQGMEYLQILTANSWYLILVAKIKNLPMLNDFLIEKINRASWMTGVWFDPTWINELSSVLARLQQNRPTPLDIGPSLYGASLKSMRDYLREVTNNGERKIKNIAHYIFDIKN